VCACVGEWLCVSVGLFVLEIAAGYLAENLFCDSVVGIHGKNVCGVSGLYLCPLVNGWNACVCENECAFHTHTPHSEV